MLFGENQRNRTPRAKENTQHFEVSTLRSKVLTSTGVYRVGGFVQTKAVFTDSAAIIRFKNTDNLAKVKLVYFVAKKMI